MRSPKLIPFLLTVVFLLSIDVRGAGAERWKLFCEGENYKRWQTDFFDFYYPEKCQGLFNEETVAVSSADDGKEEIKKQVNVLKETDTFQYYKFIRIDLYLLNLLQKTVVRLQAADIVDYSSDHCKIYLVTDSKRFANLKGKDEFSPAGNVSVDKKTRSILVCATPASRPQLEKSIGYGVVSLILREYMDSVNPEGALCDALRIGLCAHCSCLNAVVEPNRIVTRPYLLEDKLLLPSDLFWPPKMDDLEKKLYFTIQSRALVSNIMLASEPKFVEYLKVVKGGNSGFRNSFQYLYVSDKWAGSYDDFCNGLNKRIFYPLTKEPMTDPLAVAKWQKALDDEDADPPEKKKLSTWERECERESHIHRHPGIKKVYYK